MFEIGATLREARVRKRLTLQQVEDDTKIRVKYVQAMENEEFDVLPAPAYVVGFLRGYADYLGVDAELILQEYRSRHLPRSAQLGPFSGSSALEPRHYRRRRSGLAFVAVVAVLILALIYILGLRGGADGSEPRVNPSVLSPSPSASASTSAATSTASPRPQKTTVVLSARATCYVEVRKGGSGGASLLQTTLGAGESKSYSTTASLYVMIGGNPANITLTVNDRDVATSGDRSGTVYVISRGKVSKQ